MSMNWIKGGRLKTPLMSVFEISKYLNVCGKLDPIFPFISLLDNFKYCKLVNFDKAVPLMLPDSPNPSTLILETKPEVQVTPCHVQQLVDVFVGYSNSFRNDVAGSQSAGKTTARMSRGSNIFIDLGVFCYLYLV
eukprot:NODE_70_length_24940_cov_0.663138.p20 type:complete len:135 gc:universal NODE_70_length_24940_cov_0.663138:20582-20178(-)